MKKKKPKAFNLFEIFSIFWISTGAWVLFFSLLEIFSPFIIIFSAIISIALIAYFGYTRKYKIEKLSGSFKALAFFVVGVGILLSLYSTPTIFGGRDEGSYSNAAIMLVNDKERSHDSELIENFYDIYGESKALNFPGFEYNAKGHLESQFLPGYPTWVAIFYQFFGLNGIRFVNLLPLITLVLSFYLLIVEIFPLVKSPIDPKECPDGNIFRKCWLKLSQAEQFGWLGSLFLITFMPLLVFYKFTLSEIYFASLAWFALYLLIRYLKSKRFTRFKVIFIPLLLMIFVRIEALAIIFALLLIMIGKDFNHLRQARYQFFFVLSAFIFFAALWIEPNFFINALKGVLEISGLNANAIPESRETLLIKKLIPDDWMNFYSLKIWFSYNLLPFFIMAGAFLVVFFRSVLKRMKFGNERAWIITPFLFFSPTFIYLIDANISLDHPWMLRRWIFAIIPLLFLYSVLFLFYLRQKNRFLFRLIAVFAIVGNLSLFTIFSSKTPGGWTNFLTFSQNDGLIEQTQKLSKMFGKNDLLLFSQKSSGSGWSLMAEPMRNVFNRQAVYFFSEKDFADLDHDDFDEIYLITSEEEEFLYENLTKEKTAEWKIENTIIHPSRNPQEKPHSLETSTKINIYKLLK